MSNSVTTTHEFLEYPRGKFPSPRYADSGKCWEVVNMMYCGQPREAAIHRTSAPAPFEHAIKEDYDISPSSDTQPAPEADTPPEDDTPRHLKLWICCKCLAPRLYGMEGGCPACGTLLHDTAEYHRDDQCVSRSTHTAEVERLREVLRGVSVRVNPKDGACRYCWCNAWDWTKHTSQCAAARAALNSGEGKGTEGMKPFCVCGARFTFWSDLRLHQRCCDAYRHVHRLRRGDKKP